MRVLVLGAGFGGLELTTRLSDELGDAVEVTLIDKAEGFAFGFSRLDVMFSRLVADAVVHPYRDLVKPGVRFVQTTIRSIDPGQRRVETDAGSLTPTSWWSPWGPTSTRRPLPGWSKAATSSTRCPALWLCATCWRHSTAAAWWSG